MKRAAINRDSREFLLRSQRKRVPNWDILSNHSLPFTRIIIIARASEIPACLAEAKSGKLILGIPESFCNSGLGRSFTLLHFEGSLMKLESCFFILAFPRLFLLLYSPASVQTFVDGWLAPQRESKDRGSSVKKRTFLSRLTYQNYSAVS